MPNRPFDDYKSRVSIIQVALYLGYVRKSGTSRVKPEYSLYKGVHIKENKVDEIVISNPHNSLIQMYWARNKDRGDLCDFVYNRLDSFPNISYTNKWEGVHQVLSGFINEVYEIPKEENDFFREQKPFDLTRYELNPGTIENLGYLTNVRKINPEILKLFIADIYVVRDTMAVKKYDNIGFPYRVPGKPEIVNIELRNNSYKGFCEGGNKSDAVYAICLNPNHEKVKYVAFTESAIDDLSFIQYFFYKIELMEWAFVSTGGSVSKWQIINTLKEFPNALPVLGYDNDPQGNIYDIQTAAVFLKKNWICYYSMETKKIHLECDRIIREFDKKDFSSKKFFEDHMLMDKIKLCKPRDPFKDYNEIIMQQKQQ